MKPLVLVEWWDAWADHGDADPNETLHPMLCNTVGFLVKRDRLGVTLAQDGGPNHDGKWEYRGRFFVPIKMVKRVRRLCLK